MHSSLFTAPVLLAISSVVNAHGGIISYSIGGKEYDTATVKGLTATPYGGDNIQRPWTGLGPVTDSSGASMACNTPGTAVQSMATVAAGSSIKAQWNPWPHDGGPVSVWMTECPSSGCASFSNPESASWFKIHEAGLVGAKDLIKAGNTMTVTIPSSLKAGDYLIRHEIINLARPPAEFYPNCAQLTVTGSGTVKPSGSYRSTLAKAYDPSLPELTESYQTWAKKESSYVFPGPTVFG